MKEYITWTKRFEGLRNFSHPDNAITALWNGIIDFQPLHNGMEDERHIATIEYADDFTKQDRFVNNFSDYSIVRISIDKALELLIRWYGEGSFTLDADGFTLIDNRPKEEI